MTLLPLIPGKWCSWAKVRWKKKNSQDTKLTNMKSSKLGVEKKKRFGFKLKWIFLWVKVRCARLYSSQTSTPLCPFLAFGNNITPRVYSSLPVPLVLDCRCNILHLCLMSNWMVCFWMKHKSSSLSDEVGSGFVLVMHTVSCEQKYYSVQARTGQIAVRRQQGSPGLSKTFHVIKKFLF